MRVLLARALGLWVLPVAGAMAQVPTATPPQGVPVPSLSLEQARGVAPGTLIRVVGFVVGSYRCPPCPAGATCKPCAAPSEVFLAVSPDHPRVVLLDPASDVFAVNVPEPDAFTTGRQYRFELLASDRAADGIDGRMMRSQRFEDPVWPDASTEQPGVVPAKP